MIGSTTPFFELISGVASTGEFRFEGEMKDNFPIVIQFSSSDIKDSKGVRFQKRYQLIDYETFMFYPSITQRRMMLAFTALAQATENSVSWNGVINLKTSMAFNVGTTPITKCLKQFLFPHPGFSMDSDNVYLDGDFSKFIVKKQGKMMIRVLFPEDLTELFSTSKSS